jgi:hypothetical protein
MAKRISPREEVELKLRIQPPGVRFLPIIYRAPIEEQTNRKAGGT